MRSQAEPTIGGGDVQDLEIEKKNIVIQKVIIH
jgi:hypothetical protein